MMGVDTACFIRSIIPVSATRPNSCVQEPQLADLSPPSPELDAFTGVTPGTALVFQVNAINQNRATSTPCVGSTASAQVFRAFIDVLADGVTVVDTRDVIIIVPGDGRGGSN
jgi:hypothetical protein